MSVSPKEGTTPAKKNRTNVQLDATQEEDDSSSGVSPSPPTESKIRQISQGVEDITWRHIQKGSSPDRDLDMQAHEHGTSAENHPVAGTQNTHDEDVRVHDIEVGSTQAKVAGGDDVVVPPVVLQGESPPQNAGSSGEDGHVGHADLAEVLPDTQTSELADIDDREVSATSPILPAPRTTSSTRRSSQSEVEAEKGVKRKLRDRTVSERLIPGEAAEDNSVSPMVGAAKRQREDVDVDANPRVSKRPTPPPEEQETNERKTEQKAETPSSQGGEAVVTPAAPSTPKFVCAIVFRQSSGLHARIGRVASWPTRLPAPRLHQSQARAYSTSLNPLHLVAHFHLTLPPWLRRRTAHHRSL